MRASALVAFFALATAAAIGCDDDEPKRPPILATGSATPGVSGSGSSGGTDGGAVVRDAGGDAGSCTELENVANEVDQNAVTGDLPAGTGGTVLDGIYTLTEARVYLGVSGVPGPTGTTYKETIQIAGTAFERVLTFKSSGGTSSEIRSRGTFTQSGTTGTITLTCPSQNTESVTYTVGGSSLSLGNLVTKESFLFTKQP